MHNAIETLRYRDLGYVALNVSDLEKSAAFYEGMVGLQRCGGSQSTALFRCSDRHHDLLLVQGSAPGLKRIGWRMASQEDCALAAAHFSDIGVKPQAVPSDEAAALGLSADAFRIHEPNTGALFEFFSDMASSATPFAQTVAKIERLGHVVLNVVDLAEVERFCRDEMNFRVSDHIDGSVTFLRCYPNPLHHSFAISQGKANTLHHVNFMVTEVDDIGKAMNRFRKNKVPVTFGPGRHPTSESMFYYFADPDGHWIEYSFGMEEIHEPNAREPRHFTPSLASLDSWGGTPNRDFPQVGAIETST